MKKFIIFILLLLSFDLAVLSDIAEYRATKNCDHCLVLNVD